MRKIDNQIIYHIEQRGREREIGERERARPREKVGSNTL